MTAIAAAPGAASFLELKGGGRLAYSEYGDPAGKPVFFFHGWPASRLQGFGPGEPGEKMGVRIISPDRPGVGLSTYAEGRSLLDWPPLVRALADHLGLDKFHVMGLSGGGPYSFATTWALADRVIATAVVSGAPPMPPGMDDSTLLPVYRVMLRIHRRHPTFIRNLFQVVRPVAGLSLPPWTRPFLWRMAAPADAEALSAPGIFEKHFATYQESWRTSGFGVASDAEVYPQDWGFRVEDIQTPIQLWHGKDDRSFSWKLAESLASRLPRCTTHFVEGEGHYSLSIRYWKQILESLFANEESSNSNSL